MLYLTRDNKIKKTNDKVSGNDENNDEFIEKLAINKKTRKLFKSKNPNKIFKKTNKDKNYEKLSFLIFKARLAFTQ